MSLFNRKKSDCTFEDINRLKGRIDILIVVIALQILGNIINAFK